MIKNKTFVYIIIGVIFLLGLLFVIKPKSTQNKNTKPETKTFNLVVKDKKLVSGPKTLQVIEGDTVVINITSDQDEELHIHGYDKALDLGKNKKETVSFPAKISGHFVYELEKSKIEIGSLDVLPKE